MRKHFDCPFSHPLRGAKLDGLFSWMYLMTSNDEFWAKYKDPRWQKKRLEILAQRGFKCGSCGYHGGGSPKSLHVHHGYYEKGKDPWDYKSIHLHVVCEDCHEKATKLMLQIRELIGRFHPSDYHSLSDLLHAFYFGLVSATEQSAFITDDTGDYE